MPMALIQKAEFLSKISRNLSSKLRRSIADIKEFCANLDVDLPQIVAETEQLEQIRLIARAVNHILVKR